jgi:hypothetical protein
MAELVACGGGSNTSVDAASQGSASDAAMIDAANLDAAVDGSQPDCMLPISCPSATASHFSICGRVFDLESTAGLDDGVTDDGEPSQQVTVTVYDAVAFGSSSATAPPLLDAVPDTCGRFALANVALPQSGLVAVVTDDRAPAPDDRAATAIVMSASSAQLITGAIAWTLQRATDTAWSAAAALSGTSFAESGVVIPIFIDPTQPSMYPFPGTPVSGVTATRDGSTAAADDYYFTDVTHLERATIAGDATGADGTGLLLNGAGFQQYGGTGSEPANCQWQTTLDVPVIGVALVSTNLAVLTSDPSTLCR